MGSRSSKTATPWRRDRWPIDTWRTSALISMSEVLEVDVDRVDLLGQAEAACDPGKRRRLDDREDDDEHEDEVEDPLGVGVPVVRGTVASTTGTAPRRPAHERKAWSRHDTRNHTVERTTDRGRATSSRRGR